MGKKERNTWGMAARGNYLASDSVDIQYAVKELCQGMARPTVRDKKRLKRLGRYLKGRPRLVWRYVWQERPKEAEVYTDSDWAACVRTRRSTSGGVVMLGAHVLKIWSRTRKAVALSSGEAEVIGLVKGVSEGIGIQRMVEAWGREYELIGVCDSTAAMGIVAKKGVGRIRHLDVGMMWVQELRERGGLQVNKMKGTSNLADQLTRYLGKGMGWRKEWRIQGWNSGKEGQIKDWKWRIFGKREMVTWRKMVEVRPLG